MWNVGDLILGVYEVKWLNPHDQRKHYAEGGVGLVYRVHHLGWDMDLAVKCPKRDYLPQRAGALDFEGECATWIDLGLHPHIVACYYVRPWAASPGSSPSSSTAAACPTGSGPAGSTRAARPRWPRMLDIAIQFAWGLHYAHEQGRCPPGREAGQRDDAADGVPKVTDFGLAGAPAAGEAVPSEPPVDMPALGGHDAALLLARAGPRSRADRGRRRADDAHAAHQPHRHLVVGRERLRDVPRQAALSPRRPYGGRGVFGISLRRPRHPRSAAHAAAAGAILAACFEENPDDRPEGMEQIAADLLEIYQDVCGEAYPRQQPVTTELKANALNNRAVSLLDLGKDDEAGRFLEEAWQWHPWQPEVTHNRTVHLWRTGRLTDTDVVAHLEDLCNTRPRNWEPAHSLAQVQLERGEVKAALAALERAAKLGGGSEIEATHERAKSLAQHTASLCAALPSSPRACAASIRAATIAWRSPGWTPKGCRFGTWPPGIRCYLSPCPWSSRSTRR